jgi:hypothetical protein
VGQQQLLLLVLSTVIVGLAVVAGIEAFDRGQRQATQDALVQRAVSIGTDILAAHNKPSQLGGIDLESDPDDSVMASAAGLDSNGDGAGIPADGAGDSAVCDIDGSSDVVDTDYSENAYVHCGSGESGGGPRDLVVTVRINPHPEDEPFEEKVGVVAVQEGCDDKTDCDL